MEKKSSKFLFTLVLCLCLVSTQAKSNLYTQREALDNLYQNLLKQNNNLFGIDGEDVKSDYEVGIIPQMGSKEEDTITSLPGQPDADFCQYGGYITVDDKAGRAFYYYFAEAEEDKYSKPLLLWLNGGPGCSSLAYGAMTELGPFRVKSDGKTLYENPFAWNKVANVLFLESPAGVGFSYSNKSSDVKVGGDRKTALDNYVFILNWLERFPEYKNRDVYISGESYAGHYVPQLAHNILLWNKKANETLINLKGIIIGNAVINDATDFSAIYDYFNSHALISDELLAQVKNKCASSADSKECDSAMYAAWDAVGDIDIYNIYAPLCHDGNVTVHPKKASVLKFDPCSEYYVYAYLNQPQVQEALHANVTKLSYDWSPCSGVLEKWTDSASTILPLLEEFMENGLRVWVFRYSCAPRHFQFFQVRQQPFHICGDIDGRIPVTSTKLSLQKMNLTVKIPYHPWYLYHEVGGYMEEYEEGLTFVTVRGSGHMVPSDKPARALSLVKHFLDNTPFPKK